MVLLYLTTFCQSGKSSSRQECLSVLQWSCPLKRLLSTLLLILIADSHAAITQSYISYPSSSIYGFIDILSWQVREGGADNWAQVIPSAGLTVPIRIIDAPFDWNTGWRIGIGYVFEPFCHDVEIIYTTYHTIANNQAAGVVASSFDGNYFAGNTNGAALGPAYQKASIRWQFYYNTLDLNLGHRFMLASYLQLHPYIGLKTASIRQRIFSHWYNPTVATTFTSASENLKNDFLGVGPSIGIDTTWPFFSGGCQTISLIGNFAGTLLYGHWHFDDVYTNNTPVTINVHVSSVNGVAPMFGGLLGFEWTKHFVRSALRASIGYEVQAWFNQIQFYSLNGGRFNRTTYIRGGNFEVRYDF